MKEFWGRIGEGAMGETCEDSLKLTGKYGCRVF